MISEKDFLVQAATPVAGTPGELITLMQEQNNLLADAALYLRQQNPDVLATAVVHGTYQQFNQIVDTRPHQVHFEIGGKPVTVYGIMLWSTYDQTVAWSISNMANALDGMRLVANDVQYWPIAIDNIYIQAAALSATSLFINGPADATHGGFFVQGFTIPDYDRIRGSRRSG